MCGQPNTRASNHSPPRPPLSPPRRDCCCNTRTAYESHSDTSTLTKLRRPHQLRISFLLSNSSSHLPNLEVLAAVEIPLCTVCVVLCSVPYMMFCAVLCPLLYCTRSPLLRSQAPRNIGNTCLKNMRPMLNEVETQTKGTVEGMKRK